MGLEHISMFNEIKRETDKIKPIRPPKTTHKGNGNKIGHKLFSNISANLNNFLAGSGKALDNSLLSYIMHCIGPVPRAASLTFGST